MGYGQNIGDTVKKVLGATSQYIVPRYQRRYIWNEKNWQDLFDDINFIYINKDSAPNVNHFLSTLIFEKSKENKNGVDNYNIIDGQQRLSTISVIISVLCRLFNELGAKTKFNLYRQYLAANGTNGEFLKIDNNQTDLLCQILNENITFRESPNECYTTNIRKFDRYTKEQKNIFKCYTYFYDKLKNLLEFSEKNMLENRIEKLINIILDMQLITITAEDEQTGYDIFEILNARGTPLADHELLKNYILKYYQPVNNIDIAKEQWNHMESVINSKKDIYISYFIDHYTIHKYDKPNSSNSILRIIKQKNNRNDTKNILDDICLKASFYKYFLDPSLFLKNDWIEDKGVIESVYSNLLYFNLKNAMQFRPLFLSLFNYLYKSKIALDDCYDNDGKLREGCVEFAKNKKASYDECKLKFKISMEYLQNYSITTFAILNEQPKTIENLIHELAQKIERDGSDLEIIQSKLNRKIQLDTFVSRFVELGYSNKNPLYSRKKTSVDIRQLFRMYELHKNTTDELTINNFTIEHIKNDAADDDNVCKIGNLLPMAESIQVEIGETRELKDKILFYNKSCFFTVREFVNNRGGIYNWGDKEIYERSKEIAIVFYKEIFKELTNQ